MYAVVARSTIADFEQARKFLREEGIPRLSQIPGFISGHWVRLGEKAGASMILFAVSFSMSSMPCHPLSLSPPPPSLDVAQRGGIPNADLLRKVCLRHARLARTLSHRSSGFPMHRRTSLTIQPASVSADRRADSRQYVST